MNQVKNRLQSLGLLDRAFASASDDDLAGAIEALSDEHRDALAELLEGELDATSIRSAIVSGRIDGTMESVALVLTDACLAECIEELGPAAEQPSSDQLRDVLPGLVEHHGLGITRLMLASTVAGEAQAAAIIRDLLKNDDLVKLPPAEARAGSPLLQKSNADDPDRQALKARRKEQRMQKQAAERARREQAAQAKRR
ncbi:MAG: hypothetical protein RLZZ01_708 [Actinomycetota bacterium]